MSADPHPSGKTHHYEVTVQWTGSQGEGTKDYKVYRRDYEIKAADKVTIPGSSDPAFMGDAHRWNPEELLLASLSACHKLWYLHLCAVSGVVVVAYEDRATGTMLEDRERGGYFTNVTLHPAITVTAGSDRDLAQSLHHKAHQKCFIANSVNFPVDCVPEIRTQTTG